jgi:hypothetical protein
LIGQKQKILASNVRARDATTPMPLERMRIRITLPVRLAAMTIT